METFVIKWEIKFDGKFKEKFHENITPQKNKEAMNMYVENITVDKSKAKVFYKKSEAEKVINLFESECQVGEVVTL